MQKRKRQVKSQQAGPRKRISGAISRSSGMKDLDNRSLAQRLPDDVLWYIARTFFWNPTEIYDLACASRSLWRVLEKEIYITDVFVVKYHCSRGLQAPRTTLLHWAALAGRTDILQKAISAANLIWQPYLNYQHTKCGHAAVHFAAHYGRFGVVKMLETERAVDVGATSGWICPAPQRLSSILERLTPGQFQIPPDCLLQSSDFPFKLDGLGLAILKGHRDIALHLTRYYDEKRIEEEKVFSPLHLAAFVGMHEVVAAILHKGADVNSKCKHVVDSTALQWAAAGPSRLGRQETLEVLMREGADPTVRDNTGRTTLDWAIGFKVPKNMLWLLEHSVELTEPGRSAGQIEEWTKRLQRCMADDCFLDCTQFIMRVYPRLPEVCLKLCAHSTFWDIDRSWDEPGSISTGSKNSETKRWLVEDGIGLGVLNKGARQSWMQDELFLGRSFFHYVAGSSELDTDVLEAMIRQRPQDIDLIDAKGLTPLELALGYRCKPGKVQLLLRHGANPTLCYGGERARADVDAQIKQLVVEEG
ncbi:methyltransferase [Seiridium cupressi]